VGREGTVVMERGRKGKAGKERRMEGVVEGKVAARPL